ncbi:MAG: hypothetical protein AAB804_00565 [Patescibacteria group bacterium]
MKNILTKFALAGALLAPLAFAAPAFAATVVYDNVPSLGNVPSVGFEATAAKEFGGQIQLAGTDRNDPIVTVLMSSWGCESGHWYSGDCTTTPAATFSHPITLNIYNVNGDNSPGTLITTATQTFDIPLRPSADGTNCTGGNAGKWYNGSTCFNGFATPVSFNLTGVILPDKVIVSVAYNTTHYGVSPIGESAPCYTSSGGCGYDSLNVGTYSSASVGSYPLPADAYQSSTWSGAYCDGGTGGTGTFRLDAGCWTGFQPAIKVEASTPVPPEVHIFKYVDGVQATALNANGASFPMLTTFNSSVYGLVTDAPFTLSPVPWGPGIPYEASYIGGAFGDDYATHEVVSGNDVVGASCTDGEPFALVGYTTGDTLALAQAAPKSTTAPSFTNLQSDKYVIVWNQTCQDPPPLLCTDGTTQSSLLETVTIPANASIPTFSNNLLASGTDYLLKAYGTADAGDGITFDARYSFRVPTSAMWTDAVSTYEYLGTQLLDLRLNGATPWGNLDYANEYWSLVLGNGAQASFLIDDAFYPNNTGELKVDIYACMPNIKYVTGGGNYKLSKTVFWTFGGNVWQTGTGAPVGQFEVVNHLTKTNYHFNVITDVSLGDDNKTVDFDAVGWIQDNGKTPVSAHFTIVDNGEPGKDQDTILVSGLLGDPTPVTITGGNFQVYSSI